MFPKHWLPVVTLFTYLGITWAAYTNLLAQLGSHMDVSCSDEKCDRNVNERLVRIIESFMDMDVDPCDDFYKYACGNWTNVINDFSSSFEKQDETFDEIYVKIFENWQEQIEADKTDELKLNAAYEKALNYYNSCVNATDLELKEIPKNLEPAPQQKWPLFEDRTSLPWNFENFVWWKVLAKLQSYDMTEVLLSATVDNDMRNRRRYGIVMSIPTPHKTVDELPTRIFDAMGFHSNLERTLLQDKLLSFEKQLVKAVEGVDEEKEEEEEQKQNEETKSSSENEVDGKLKGSSEEEGKIERADSSSSEEEKKEKTVSSEESEKVKEDKEEEEQKEDTRSSSENEVDGKLKGSSEEVEKTERSQSSSSEEEKKEKTASTEKSSSSSESTSSESEESNEYITLSELQSQLPGVDWQEYFNILLQDETKKLPNGSVFVLSEDVKPPIQRLIKFLNESSKETVALYLLAYFIEFVERPLPFILTQKRCANNLRLLMPLTMDHIYEENYYGAIREESDAVIRNVFDRLTSKLNDLIEENTIDLTQQEIDYLKVKSNKMRLSIGNLPENKTTEFLVDYYANVNITNATNFYHNHLELLHHKQLLQYRILNAYTENAENIYESFDAVMGWDASASPYHSRTRNLIVLPFAYLQMPLYHHKLHDVFQYAELGFTTGHEIMHGFDASGLWFDADGNYNDIGVGIGAKSGFQKKLGCLSQERTASIDERIADVAGIRLVMETFFNERTGKAKKFHTHSTALTNRQLFFVKLSQYFCQELDEDDEKVTDLSELSHDLSNVRVVYTMSNTREFAREFRCKENTALKLEKVCQLW